MTQVPRSAAKRRADPLRDVIDRPRQEMRLLKGMRGAAEACSSN
jgi:hypothetical protein